MIRFIKNNWRAVSFSTVLSSALVYLLIYRLGLGPIDSILEIVIVASVIAVVSYLIILVFMYCIIEDGHQGDR